PGSVTTIGTPVRRFSTLVLSDAWEERGRFWCDVVPLSTDIENATSVDLLLRRGDTNIGVPWRVLFRYQTVAAIRQLEQSIGSLTEEGRAVVRAALIGRAPDERFGSAIESSDDPRTQIPEELDYALRIIGQDYAQILEIGEAKAPAARVLSFEMRKGSIKSVTEKTTFRLAAATDAEQEGNLWIVEIPERGRIEGRIEHRYADDELFFVVSHVEEHQIGILTTAWIAA